MLYRTGLFQATINRRLLFCASLLLCAAMLLCASARNAVGQSGRRAGRPAEPSGGQPPVGVRDGAATANGDRVEAARLSLFVADYFSSDAVPATRAREVIQSFIGRLRERSSTAMALAQERDVKRKEAIERARKAEKSYVVWLEVEPDEAQAAPDVDATGFDTLVINYVVFAPGTAEIKTEGRIYYQHVDERAVAAAMRTRKRRRLPPLRQPAEDTLEAAGRAAADRVLASFKDILPQT